MQKKRWDHLAIIIVIVFLLYGRLVGVQGENVLSGVFATGAAYVMLGAFLVHAVALHKDACSKSVAAAVLAGILICGSGLYIESGVVLDMAGGTRSETFAQCSVSHRPGFHGILTPSCYVTGRTEDGRKIRFPVTYASYGELREASRMSVEYYPHTGRIVTYNILGKKESL